MGQPPVLYIRQGTSDDLLFLGRMLFEAFFWQEDCPRPSLAEFSRSNHEYEKLLAHWGRAGDRAMLAEISGQPVGAAWYRCWTDEIHSYGYVDSETPEIGIGVEKAWRRRGIGRALLRTLLAEAACQGFKQISLSVQPTNPARQLYESEGFVKIAQVGGAWTMVKKFA